MYSVKQRNKVRSKSYKLIQENHLERVCNIWVIKAGERPKAYNSDFYPQDSFLSSLFSRLLLLELRCRLWPFCGSYMVVLEYSAIIDFILFASWSILEVDEAWPNMYYASFDLDFFCLMTTLWRSRDRYRNSKEALLCGMVTRLLTAG